MPSVLSSRARRLGVAAALAVGLSGLAVTTSSASDNGSVEIRVRDNCDAPSFNAALGFPVCQGSGNTPFAEFGAALATGGHPKWRFQPSSIEVKAGTRFVVVNRGGEVHSFNEVTQFGKTGFNGGALDVALGNAPAWMPLGPPAFTVPGEVDDIGILPPGTHMFQCFIHPWMRTTIVVKNT